MLFQPTNITPDLRGALGNGVVDATDDFIVTWQINGTSGMDTFQITIYNTSNVQVYQSSVITETSTVYGTNAYGERQLFYYNFGDLSSYISNGNEYRLKITMTNTALTQTVVQNSASAFITRAQPSLLISSTKSTYTQFPATISTRSCHIYGIYSQAQGDTLNWIRWKLAYTGDLDNPIYDSQNIYGTGELEMKYDGFLTGVSYSVKCIIETSSGVEVDSGWTTFYVSYQVNTLSAVATAARINSDTTGVLLEWGGFNYIYGETVGTCTITDDNTLLMTDTESSVYWDEETGRALSIETDWNIITRTKLLQGDSIIFSVDIDTHNVSARYVYSTRTLTLYYDNTSLDSIFPLSDGTVVTLMLSPEKFYVRYTQESGGLVPTDTLYPSETLYPSSTTGQTLYKTNHSVTYTQDDISKVSVHGCQENEFLQIIVGDITEITTVISGTEYTIEDAVYEYGLYTTGDATVEGSEFLADYNGDLNAGTLYISGSAILGWAIYRQTTGETVQKHLADLALSAGTMIDYGVPQNFGSYKYYIYPIGDTKYITSPIISNVIAPCYWSYSILECEYDDLNDVYQVVNEFAFGKNISTKDISNNNAPTINNNFTKYPTVQLACQNYMSGSLTSLIGSVSVSDGNVIYSDDKTLRDDIFALSTTNNTLFLKTRKGDVMLIRIAGEISMSTMDGTREQALTATIPWVEIGDAKDCCIIQAELYEE